MKRIVKIAALLPIIIVYCFLSGSYTTNYVASRAIPGSGTEKNRSSIVAPDLFLHTNIAENPLRGFNPFTFSQKNKLPYLWTTRECFELILLNRYAKYIFSVKNIFDWFKPTDIIFPFHYFW